LDFGTTYSFASFLNGDSVQPLVPHECRLGIPSLYFKEPAGGFSVGMVAEHRGKSRPDMLARSPKQRLGNERIVLSSGESVPTREVIGEIVSHALKCAQVRLKRDYPDALEDLQVVVSYPVSFGNNRKAIIADAVKNAVLSGGRHPELLGMLPEPVAAAIEYFGMAPDPGKNILICDLGGGTYDLALVRSVSSGKPPYEVLSQAGIRLGGDDWDLALAALIEEKLVEKYGSIPLRLTAKILQEANFAKIWLSDSMTAQVSLEHGDDIFDIEISRWDFEDCTSGLLGDLVEATLDFKEENLEKKLAIDKVVLVGGGCKMPMVAKAIDGMFPDIDRRLYNPETAVSFGAARYAVALEPGGEVFQISIQEEERRLITLLSTHTIGIRYYVGRTNTLKVKPIIKKGSRLPASGVVESSTVGKTSFNEFFVYETTADEDETGWVDLDKCKLVKKARFEYGREVPEGTVTRDELRLGLDSLLEICVEDPVTKAKVEESVLMHREVAD
jgi:molecular chaperone DnaK (HSP70)